MALTVHPLEMDLTKHAVRLSLSKLGLLHEAHEECYQQGLASVFSQLDCEQAG